MWLVNFILHIGDHLQELVKNYGNWIYAILFALKKIKPDYLSIAKTSQPPLPKFTRALHQLQCPRNT